MNSGSFSNPRRVFSRQELLLSAPFLFFSPPFITTCSLFSSSFFFFCSFYSSFLFFYSSSSSLSSPPSSSPPSSSPPSSSSSFRPSLLQVVVEKFPETQLPGERLIALSQSHHLSHHFLPPPQHPTQPLQLQWFLHPCSFEV